MNLSNAPSVLILNVTACGTVPLGVEPARLKAAVLSSALYETDLLTLISTVPSTGSSLVLVKLHTTVSRRILLTFPHQ